jgi:8-oxo-dGTP pyrophosphatase MutT (NUDIX family)
MSLQDRIRQFRAPDMSRFVPWRIAGIEIGQVRRDVADLLARFPSVFSVNRGNVDLMAHLVSFEQRSAALNEVAKALSEAGVFSGWRNEPFPVVPNFRSPPLARLERAAIPVFGVPAYGVHVNGFVRDAGDLRLWVGTRAADRPVEPGKLDHLAAGGVNAALDLRRTLIDECQEEAGLAPDLSARAIPVGAIRYRTLHQGWLRNDTIFVFDLEGPADFRPVNHDGEIAGFELMNLDRVERILAEGDSFKFNVGLVVIDFLIRHGALGPERPDYGELALSRWRA